MESQQDFIHIIVHTTSHGNPSTENKFFFFSQAAFTLLSTTIFTNYISATLLLILIPFS